MIQWFWIKSQEYEKYADGWKDKRTDESDHKCFLVLSALSALSELKRDLDESPFKLI